jgi:hypothetical protein
MAITAESIDRLKSQLLTSNLSQQNQPLFQIINQLIDAVRQTLSGVAVITGSGGGGGSILSQSFITINNDQATLANSRRIVAGNGIFFNIDGERITIHTALPFPRDGEDGEMGPIGPPGIQGIRGLQGIQGPPGFDSVIGEEIIPLPIETLLIGPWIDIPFNAGNYTGNGTLVWTVAVGDQTAFGYTIVNDNIVILNIRVETTSVSGTGNTLAIALPAAITPKKSLALPCLLFDNGGNANGFITMTAGSASVGFVRGDTGNFAAAVNSTSVYVVVVYER